MTHKATLEVEKSNATLQCGGEWTFSGLETLSLPTPATLKQIASDAVCIEADAITHLDSAGALLLQQLSDLIQSVGKKPQFQGLKPNHQNLFNWIVPESAKLTRLPKFRPLPWIEQIGKRTLGHYREALHFTNFLGMVLINCLHILRHPRNFQWRAWINVIEDTGYRALPIVGLLSFLIGVVLTYQMGQQLRTYGANVYIVSLLGVAVLQEFAPLITAIIVVSRTASAFTAEIGTMRVKEEVDALQTLGISPIERLVVPKMFGLLVSLPLLIIWADIFGVLGGMLISNGSLGVGFYGFLVRFPKVVFLQTFMNGLVKAPVFALIVASVGCFQGFAVDYTAESIGRQTTKSVVQAVFLIVIVDAIFSIILPWQEIS
ncbi:MAG: ABC transporter permease [Gammaproteobacteria bacterium]